MSDKQKQKIEFKIKVEINDQEDDNIPQQDENKNESNIYDDQSIQEESMVVTFDSLKITAKRTTTPKRILNSYSISKRSMASVTPSERNPVLNPQSNSKSEIFS